MTTTIDLIHKLKFPAKQAIETIADYILRQAGPEPDFLQGDEIWTGLTQVRNAINTMDLAAELSIDDQEHFLEVFCGLHSVSDERHCPEDAESRWRRVSNLLVAVGLELAKWRLSSNEQAMQENEPPPARIDLREYELLASWCHYGFILHLYDTCRVDCQGKSILAYELLDEEHGGKLIFEGDDFHASPLHAIDSDATAASLLGFLSLRPGDTDSEYFDCYGSEQLEWCQVRGEELALLAEELRQPYRPIAHHVIEHETWDEARQAGRYNRALVLTYRERGGEKHRVTLSAGESDHVNVLTDGDAVYALSANFRLDSVGLECWIDGDDAGDVFFQNNVESELGHGFWDLGTAEMIQTLAEYLPY